MGKSKNGGTRSMLRGRVGSDVYSIGKDSQGKRQQVVRSLAESVANPQTAAQMKGRAIMSTVMQAVSAMAGVIDHSFDNVVAGQPSISEFIRVNYALIKADVEAHASTGNEFGIVKYGEKGAKFGKYQVSNGNAALPSALQKQTDGYKIVTVENAITVGAVKTALGLATDEYFTLVGINASGEAEIARFRLANELTDETTLTSENISKLFAVEANCTPQISLQPLPSSGQQVVVKLQTATSCFAAIISRLENGVYKHNKAILGAPSAPAYTYAVAIATYPIGEQRLLNGGNVWGDETGGTVAAAESASPTPSPTPSGGSDATDGD